MFALFSCSSALPPETLEEPAPQTEKEKNSGYPVIPNPLTWADIDAIPVATGDMTSDQLRQICLDYFRLQLTFLWTPSESFSYEISSQKKFPELYRGMIYAGLPYDSGAGNLYKVMKYYDSATGVLNVTGPGEDFAALISNQCSYGAFWAWARVANSMTFDLTNTITASGGAIPVGPYQYDFSLHSFKEYPTDKICQDNGKEVMYQSYAALLPADGIVHFNGAGHVQMVVKSVPVYREDGSLDEKESHVIILDQGSTWERKKENGLSYAVQGGVDEVSSYESLYQNGYLPFTLSEFVGLDPVEAPEVSLGIEEETVRPKDLSDAVITSNYSISDVTLTVTSPTGEILYSYIGLGTKVHCYEFAMSSCAFPATLGRFAQGENRIAVDCRISTGEVLRLYEGVLIAP